MEDFKPSKNYPALFADALAIKNIEKMHQVFSELCNEVGLVDSATITAQRSAAEAIAVAMNQRDQGVGGIKV